MVKVKTTRSQTEYIKRKVSLREVFGIKPGQRVVYGTDGGDVFVKILLEADCILNCPSGEESIDSGVDDNGNYYLDTAKDV